MGAILGDLVSYDRRKIAETVAAAEEIRKRSLAGRGQLRALLVSSLDVLRI